ncbi:MAG TPA: hypothetical protein PKW55_03575 [Spirochaetota bacterium]|nr:hypothetical protein [Spirochaetota bacterium]HOM38084.1 hypothetical protein [Spirochaetota bacterium]HPQ48886.1 hypothetical protein [Spirochaetota bacterium]
MQRYSIPIFLAVVTSLIVILGGIIGGAPIGKIFQRLLFFSILMGFLGFVLIYILEKWGIDLNSPASNDMSSEENQSDEEGEVETPGNEESEKIEAGSVDKIEKSDDSGFTYTVDDEEIEFTPLDDTIIEKSSSEKEIVINGEKIQYDPKKAAAAIRQLLSEDKENE